jgi:hypothetical protein
MLHGTRKESNLSGTGFNVTWQKVLMVKGKIKLPISQFQFISKFS